MDGVCSNRPIPGSHPKREAVCGGGQGRGCWPRPDNHTAHLPEHSLTHVCQPRSDRARCYSLGVRAGLSRSFRPYCKFLGPHVRERLLIVIPRLLVTHLVVGNVVWVNITIGVVIIELHTHDTS